MSTTNSASRAKRSEFQMPAEWEAHQATWIAWPHHEPDWPGKLESIHWVYTEIVRVLSAGERVEVLCHDASVKRRVQRCLSQCGVTGDRLRLHLVPSDRSWVRDSGPTAVRHVDGALRWICWRFNAWAKYPNFGRDAAVAGAVASLSGLPPVQALRPDDEEPLVLEGGAIDTDGEGTLLTTEQCLLSQQQQVRNPGLSRQGYEQAFARYLGVRKVIWLGQGCAGDDTGGHVDDVARWVGPATVVLVHVPDPADDDHRACEDNLRRLRLATDARGRRLKVVTLPAPRPIFFDGERLPASYANFYIANEVVLVPTFNDVADRVALETLAGLFPGRQVVGIHALDLVWGFGTLHCSTQQQPA